jgi:hypothetical protein
MSRLLGACFLAIVLTGVWGHFFQPSLNTSSLSVKPKNSASLVVGWVKVKKMDTVLGLGRISFIDDQGEEHEAVPFEIYQDDRGKGPAIRDVEEENSTYQEAHVIAFKNPDGGLVYLVSRVETSVDMEELPSR